MASAVSATDTLSEPVAPSGNEVALISPYGGELVNPLIPEEERASVVAYANHLPSVRLSERAICDWS